MDTLRSILVVSLVLFGPIVAHAKDIIERAEASELRLSSDKATPRVERDAEGNITVLRLDQMQLSPEDVARIGRLAHLRRLILVRSNITDEDLTQLRNNKQLEHLNLSSTSITNKAIDTLVELRSLKTVCLGNVDITPDALKKLEDLNRSRGNTREHLRWGYYQRKQETK